MHCSLDAAKAKAKVIAIGKFVTATEIDEIVAINTRSFYPSSQGYASHMTARGYGRIINTVAGRAERRHRRVCALRCNVDRVIMLTKYFAQQFTDKFALNGELSGCDGGAAGKAGVDYQYDDRSSVYMTAGHGDRAHERRRVIEHRCAQRHDAGHRQAGNASHTIPLDLSAAVTHTASAATTRSPLVQAAVHAGNRAAAPELVHQAGRSRFVRTEARRPPSLTSRRGCHDHFGRGHTALQPKNEQHNTFNLANGAKRVPLLEFKTTDIHDDPPGGSS